MAEGSYENGEPVGRWTNVFPDGTVFEGEWANGRRRGKWTLTYGDDVGGGFYAAGERHGRWKLVFAASDDETVRGTAEGLYVAGNRNGPWVTRFDEGTVHEITWRNGVRHGPSSSRYASGAEEEGPYQDGKKEGHWTERSAAGKEDSGPYKEGKKHGHWSMNLSGRPFLPLSVSSHTFGANVGTGRFEEDKKQGEWVYRFEDGDVMTVTYKEGSPSGPFSERDVDGSLVQRGSIAWNPEEREHQKAGTWEETLWWDGNTHAKGHFKGPYVDDERHGHWLLEHDDGRREEGSYKDGEKDGLWKTSENGINVQQARFVNGERNGEWKRTGRWVVRQGPTGYDAKRIPAGTVLESGSYGADGRKTGKWVERKPTLDGDNFVCCEVETGSYVEGKKEGRWETRTTHDRWSNVSFWREGRLHGPATTLGGEGSGSPGLSSTIYFISGERVTRKEWNRWVKANRRR